MSLIDQFPRYRAAVEREAFVRNVAFLPVTETMCDMEVVPLTIRKWLLLEVVKSPFVVGGLPRPVDLVQFLWCLSPAYAPNRRWRRLLLARRCRRFRGVPEFIQAVDEVREFIREAWQDGPGSSPGEHDVPYYSYAASLVARFGKEFGWPPDVTMDLNLKIALQLIKALKQASQPDCILHNPSDKVRRLEIERQREELKAN